MSCSQKKEDTQHQEHFKGRGGGSGGNLALGVGALGAATSSGGSNTVTVCPTSDTTFYCQLTRFLGSLKMIIMIILIIIIVAFCLQYGYKYLQETRKHKKK